MPAGTALLTAAEIGDRLRLAVAGELVSWRVRTLDQRREGATASYLARVRDAAGERTVHLGATTRPVRGAAPSGGVHVWAWPDDPELPGLAAACRPSRVAALVGQADPPALGVVAYRPGRRAVVEARSAGRRWFVKVLPPGRAAAVEARHAALADTGLPVAGVLARTDDGRLLLPALPGTRARDQLRGGGPGPSGRELLALLDRLPRGLLELPARASWSDGVAHYGSAAARALRDAGRRDDAVRAERLAARVGAVIAGAPPGADPVHGDLHEGQLLLDSAGRVSGLLDLDGAGSGRRTDDLACLLAHLDVLALLPGWPAAALLARRAEWHAAFAAAVDPQELAARTAGVLLSLATGPYRVQERHWPAATAARLAAAERALVPR